MKREINSMEHYDQSGTEATPKVLSRRELLGTAVAIATVGPMLGLQVAEGDTKSGGLNPRTMPDCPPPSSLTPSQKCQVLALWLTFSAGGDAGSLTGIDPCLFQYVTNAYQAYNCSAGAIYSSPKLAFQGFFKVFYGGNQCPSLGELQAIANLMVP
jgi:hypothetical protein